MRLRTVSLLLAAGVLHLLVGAQHARGQRAPDFGNGDALERLHPQLHAAIQRAEAVQAMVFARLAVEHATDDDPGEDGLEILTLPGSGDSQREDAERYVAVGERAADVIKWSQAFRREVISLLADPEVVDKPGALADAVRLYEAGPAALPRVPKNMDVLYGHSHALAFRTAYPSGSGHLWAGRWLYLAATEPLTDLPAGPERSAGVDTVIARYVAKVTAGEPPHALPSELPLAPAIAPGLIWLSPEAAMIWDNSSMLMEVLADVLASANAEDVDTAIDATLDYFLDPDLAVTTQDEWEIMALRHGIFFQGGFPLAVMTQNERNVGGHAAHLMGGGMLRSIPGMPR